MSKSHSDRPKKRSVKNDSSFSTVRKTNVIISLFFLVFSLVMLIPLIWMVSSSFKSLDQIWQPNWLPDPITLDNYKKVAERIPVVRFLTNSMIVSIISTVIQLLVATLAAYSFARIRFRGRQIIFMTFLGTMMIPSYILIIPLYLMIDRLGLANSYAGLIMPKMVSVFAIFMLRQFFLSIPRELDESATIDGANRLKILFKVIVPLAKPAYAALFIFCFMGVWNDFLWPLIVTSEENMRTIQVGIAYFKDANTTDYGATMAASFLASVPILIVFLIANRKFVQGITMTGIKA